MRPPDLRPCAPDGTPISERRIAELCLDATEAALIKAKLADDPYAERAPGAAAVPDPYPEESMPREYWTMILSDVDRGEDLRPYPQREDGSE